MVCILYEAVCICSIQPKILYLWQVVRHLDLMAFAVGLTPRSASFDHEDFVARKLSDQLFLPTIFHSKQILTFSYPPFLNHFYAKYTLQGFTDHNSKSMKKDHAIKIPVDSYYSLGILLAQSGNT